MTKALDQSKYYDPGKPCRNGHLALRRLSDAVCVTCEHERFGRWKEKNRSHVRERDARQKNKDRDKIRSQGRARYAADPASHIDKQKRFYAANGEKIRERRKAYHYRIYTDKAVRISAAERTKKWTEENPERAKANRRNGKAKRKHIPGTHAAEDIADIFKMQKGRCAYCRKPLGLKYEVDHIKPVSKGGTNDRKNIQLTHSKCNRAKGAREPEFHARMLGMLI